MVATATDIKLRGLPRRLVQEGVIAEEALRRQVSEERARAEATLRTSERRYRAVVEDHDPRMPDQPALAVLDALDRIPGLEGRAGIKWVNDILVEASDGGVLARGQLWGLDNGGIAGLRLGASCQ